MDRHYYQQHTLTLAKHPSETDERMMVRLVGFSLYANENLVFGKGLSDDEEPDLWKKDLTGSIELWMDVGLPEERLIRKACGRSKQVVMITYGGRIADMWWDQNSKQLLKQTNLTVINLPETESLAKLAEKNFKMNCNIQDGQMYISSGDSAFELTQVYLHKPAN